MATRIKRFQPDGTSLNVETFTDGEHLNREALNLKTSSVLNADGVELNATAANPGAVPKATIYRDDGTNYNADTIVIGTSATPVVMEGAVDIGDPGFEQGAITVQGFPYPALLMIHDIAGAAASLNIHKHSTVFPAVLAMSRSNTNDNSHAIVTDNMELGVLAFLGHDGVDYNRGAEIQAVVDGTPGANSMPTRLEFLVSPSGSNDPELALQINQDKTAEFKAGVDITGALTLGTALAIAGGGSGQSTAALALNAFVTGSAALTTPEMTDTVGMADISAGTAKEVTRADLLGYNRQAFRVYRSVDVSLAGGDWQKVPFNAASYDVNAAFNRTLNRYIPQVEGYYQVEYSVGWSSNLNSVSAYDHAIYKNGAVHTQKDMRVNATSTRYAHSGSDLIYMNGTTDYLEVFMFMGSTETVQGLATETYFSGFLAVPA